MRLPLLLLRSATMFILTAVATLPVCKPQDDNAAVDLKDSTQLSILQKLGTVDLGLVDSSKTTEIKSNLENSFGKPFVVTGVERTCSCEDVQVHSEIIAPGDKAEFTLKFSPGGATGTLRQKFAVLGKLHESDQTPTAQFVVEVLAEAHSRLEIFPKNLKWDLDRSRPDETPLEFFIVNYFAENDAQPTVIFQDADAEATTHRLDKIPAGFSGATAAYKVQVKSNGGLLPKSFGFGRLRFKVVQDKETAESSIWMQNRPLLRIRRRDVPVPRKTQSVFLDLFIGHTGTPLDSNELRVGLVGSPSSAVQGVDYDVTVKNELYWIVTLKYSAYWEGATDTYEDLRIEYPPLKSIVDIPIT